MEIEEIKDSAKAWLSDKLKNPFFAAAFAVWIITNRVVVFSLFNFHEEMSLQQRTSLIHQQLENKTILFFGGFYGIIIYSFIVGFISMIVFNYLNVFGKWGYNFFGTWANHLKHKIEPQNWISRFEVEKIIKKSNEFEKEIETHGTSIIRLKQENEVAIASLSKLKEEKEILGKENERLKSSKEINITEHNSSGNQKDKLNDQFALNNFLNSTYKDSFDAIMGYIRAHRPIGIDVTQYVLDFYHSNDLISMSGNLYILTPKGEKYYKEYLKVKETK